MNHDATPKRDRALETDSQLREQLAHLLMRADRRQLWMLFLGSDHRLLDPIMPTDDLPLFPDAACDTEDLRRVPFSRLIVERAGSVLQMLGGGSIVLAWERPGPPKPASLDLAWTRAAARAADDLGVALRAQFLLHDGGVRQFTEGELELERLGPAERQPPLGKRSLEHAHRLRPDAVQLE
jgi:hypothetical protein